MKRVLSTVPLLLLLSAVSAQEPLDAHLVDGIAAEVNGEPITVSDVIEEIRDHATSPHAKLEDLPPEALQNLYSVCLDGLIRAKLALQEYETGEMRLPDWIIDKRVSEIIDSKFGGDRSKLVNELARQKKTFTEWRDELQRETILMAMRQMNVDKGVLVGPAEILKYYRDHEAEFTRPAGTHLLLIQLKPQPDEPPEAFESRVATIRKRLDKEPFQEIARFFSVDSHAANGGDWGWMDPDNFRKELATALNALPVGEISDPIVTPAGVYILRKEAVRESGLQPLDSVRDEIVATLRRQESERLFREWTDKLRTKAQLRILRPTM